MKSNFYFEPVKTLEELKEKYRRYCIAMHPDRGGSEEEFKAMQAEYERAALRFTDSKQSRAAADAAAAAAEEARRRAEERRREEEEARRYEEEERRRREKEEREERERIEKARAALRPIIAKWSKTLEQVPQCDKYNITPAYRAAVVRNLKKILAKYFPGVIFKISLSWATYKEHAEISWKDGPSIQAVQAVKELNYYLFTGYNSDPYADYGYYYDREELAEWCEKFGDVPGPQFDFKRYFSDIAKDYIYKKIWEAYPETDQKKDNDFIIFSDCIYGTISKTQNFAGLFGLDTFETHETARNSWGDKLEMTFTKAFHTLKHLYKIPDACDINKQPKDNAPKFRPTYGPKIQALKKALGGNCFAYCGEGGEFNDSHKLDLCGVLSRVASGQDVYLAKPYTNNNGVMCYMSICWTSWATDEKRKAKFDAVGISLNRNGHIISIDPAFVAAYGVELSDIERQRAEWERQQQEAAESTTAKKKATKKGKTAAAASDTTTRATDKTTEETTAAATDGQDTAPAAALELVEIAGGVAVVGKSRATYKNRKEIKAHGAAWNKDAQQWQATDPAAVASLRAWFALRDAAAAPAEEPTATAEEITTKDKGTATTANDEQAAAVAAAVASLIASIADIIQALEQYREAEEQARQCEQLAALLSQLADIITTAAAYIPEGNTAAPDAATVPGDFVAGQSSPSADEQAAPARPEPFTAARCASWSSRAASGDLSRVLGEICAALAFLVPDMANIFNYYGMGFYSGDFDKARPAYLHSLAALVRSVPATGHTVADFIESLAA